MLVDLLVEPLGHLPPAVEVGPTCVRGDREPVGDGDAELRHLGKTDPLSAQKLATAARVLAEVEDVAHLREESTDTARYADPARSCGCLSRVRPGIACWCAMGVTRDAFASDGNG